MFKYCFSILLAFSILLQSKGQSDTTYVKDSTKKIRLIKPKIRLGLDVSRLFLSAIRNDFKGGEASVDANIGKHIYEFHLGYATHSQQLDNYKPVSSGVYGSIGYSKNVFSESDNILSVGGRLAGSSFGFQAKSVKLEDVYSSTNQLIDFEKIQCSAIWGEFVSSMRAKIYGWIMMGFEVRLKARLYAKADGYQPYVIPGYGFYSGKTSIGFNYFIFINLPTVKK